MISVILPTYNRRELLPRAINSVLEQTYGDLELIVVDDASTDGTHEVMAEITDPRVRYIRQKQNKGACAARNAGIREAKGDYIAFQDSDDVWHTDKLEKQLAFLSEKDADIVFCAFSRFEGDALPVTVPDLTRVKPIVAYERLLEENVISTQTILGKKECFQSHPFDESFPRMQDWELVLRLSQHYPIHFQPEVLADVYLQGNSISKNNAAGILALEKLHQIHKNALLRHDRAALGIASAQANMALKCRQPAGRIYLSYLSPALRPRTNLYLIKRSLMAALLKV